jgi:hypothetical protein
MIYSKNKILFIHTSKRKTFYLETKNLITLLNSKQVYFFLKINFSKRPDFN